MRSITAKQILGARAMLKWKRCDLVDASKLCYNTIRNAENGSISVQSAVAMREAFEKEGIRFHDDNGVSCPDYKYEIYTGPNACDKFFEDILGEVKDKHRDVAILSESLDRIAEVFGLVEKDKFERFRQICDYGGKVECIVADAGSAIHLGAKLDLKIHPKYVGHVTKFSYGDRHVCVTQQSDQTYHYTVHKHLSEALYFVQNEFLLLWHDATTFAIQSLDQRSPRAPLGARG